MSMRRTKTVHKAPTFAIDRKQLSCSNRHRKQPHSIAQVMVEKTTAAVCECHFRASCVAGLGQGVACNSLTLQSLVVISNRAPSSPSNLKAPNRTEHTSPRPYVPSAHSHIPSKTSPERPEPKTRNPERKALSSCHSSRTKATRNQSTEKGWRAQ